MSTHEKTRRSLSLGPHRKSDRDQALKQEEKSKEAKKHEEKKPQKDRENEYREFNAIYNCPNNKKEKARVTARIDTALRHLFVNNLSPLRIKTANALTDRRRSHTPRPTMSRSKAELKSGRR